MVMVMAMAMAMVMVMVMVMVMMMMMTMELSHILQPHQGLRHIGVLYRSAPIADAVHQMSRIPHITSSYIHDKPAIV